MRDMLTDVIRHTGGLQFFSVAKVTSDGTATKIDAMDDDRTIILNAVMKEPCAKLQGVFGIARFNLLQGFLNFANYRSDNADIEVKNKTLVDGTISPEEIVFHDNQGQSSTFRFMSAEHIPEQAKFLGGKVWDVEVQPTRSKIQEFIQLSAIMSEVESMFLARTVDNCLKFYIGDEDATTDRTCVTIGEDVTGTLQGELYWDCKKVGPILKLGLEEDVKIRISNKGAFQLSMTSALAEYNFTLPAHKK